MKAGDIILFKPKGLLGRLIAWVTKSEYSHSAVVFGKEYGKVLLLEIDWTKSRIVTLESMTREYDVFRVDKLEGREEDFKRNIIESGKYFNVMYDYEQLFSFVRRILFRAEEIANSPDKYICSELVDRAYKDIGIDLVGEYDTGEVSPEDLADSKLTKKVEVTCMKSDFEKAFDKVIVFEGGYSDNPYDSGGKTKYGITEQTARSFGYKGDMRDLTLEKAKEIYKAGYWDRVKASEFDNFYIKEVLFDTAVNMGTGTAVKLLQKALNLLEQNEIVEDGIVGSQTINRVNEYAYQKDLVFWFLVKRLKRYDKIVERNESQKVFIRGWGRRVQRLLEEVL